jgi:hypothetical protein
MPNKYTSVGPQNNGECLSAVCCVLGLADVLNKQKT